MESKFYVSYEAARLLREKGYDEQTKAAWCGVFGDLMIASGVGAYQNSAYPDDIKIYSAPTKAEAIDWLDARRFARIVIHYRPYSGEWYGEVISFENWTGDITYDYKTRLEAEEAAIIKALELL